MATPEELIYLDPDEEITAIIDRLRQTDARLIRLVVPKGALVLQSLVSLKLLKREADQFHKRIALVTQDAVGQRLAARAELAVYRKPKDDVPVVDAPYLVDQEEEAEPAVEPEEEIPVEDAPEGLSVHRYDRSQDPVDDQDGEGSATPPTDQATEPLPAAALRALGRTTTRGAARWKKPLTIVAVLGILGALGGFVFVEFFPRATIALTLATEPLEQVVVVKGTTEIQEPDLANAKIPAVRRDVEARAENQAPATGKKQVGEKASASVKLYNYWDSNPQTIAVGTAFRADDGTPFVATEAVTIPGATTTLSQGQIVTTPGTVNTVIQAESAGTEANGKDGIMTIPSLPSVRQDKIYGETINPSAGGTSREITIVTQADLDALKNATRDALTADGKTKLADGVEGRLVEGAIELAVTNESASASVGDEASTLTYTMIGQARGLIVGEDELKTATIAILERAIPSGRMLVLRDNDSLSAIGENLVIDPGTIDIRVTVSSRTALSLDVEQVAETVTGLTIQDAESRLRETPGVTAVTISGRPRWLKTLPKRPSQITISTTVAEE